MSWGIKRIEQIAATLGRAPKAIYCYANHLGLGLGVPQGFESIRHAAHRAGFRHAQLKQLLHWASVHVRPSATHPDFVGRLIVEPADVDDAVARWCAAETARDAARRLGCNIAALHDALRDAEARGELPANARVGKGRQWRLDPLVIDRVVAERRAAGSKAFPETKLTEGDGTK